MMPSSQHDHQTQQQDPPPPPTAASRYLLVVPKSVTSLESLGLRFAPRHESRSDASRSIGAKISSLTVQRGNVHDCDQVRTWIQQYDMKVGDVLIKVNDEILKTRSYGSIMDGLNSLLRSQRQSDQYATSESISLILERGEQTEQRSEDCQVDQMHSYRKAPQDAGDRDLSLSVDLSREHNVLHSIFSGKQLRHHLNTDDSGNNSDLVMDRSECSSTSGSSPLMFPFGHTSNGTNSDNQNFVVDVGDEDFSTLNESIGYDLSAIPEGVESETSRDSDAFVPAKNTTQQHKQQRQDCLRVDVPSTQQTLPTTIYQSQQHSFVSNELSGSAESPSFSYSDSECHSHVDENTPNQKTDEAKSKNVKSIYPTSTRNGREFSEKTSNRVENEADNCNLYDIEPRSSYFSPESDQPSKASIHNLSHRSKIATSHKLDHYTSNNVFTPRNQLKSKATYFQSPISEIHPTSSLESCSVSTVYLSPLSNLPLSSSKNAAELSTGSSQKETSKCSSRYKDIPIHMLDYSYVRNCTSKVELEKIVKVLSPSKHGEVQQFPSLLRLAKTKLNEVTVNCKTCAQSTNSDRRNTFTISNKLDSVLDQANDIPSHIHVEIQTSLEDKKFDTKGVSPRTLSTTSKEDESALVENMNSIVIAHAELQDRIDVILGERDAVQERLKAEIMHLKEKLHHAENDMKKQRSEKIAKLERAKEFAEQEAVKLRDVVVSSSKEAKKVIQRLDKVEREAKDLKSMLVSERESKRVEVEEAKCIQTRLEQQVINLTRQVELHEEDDKVTRELLELELRSEYHATSQIERARINELESCLMHTREELNRMYREHDALSEEFAMVGKNPTTPSQFREILKEFAAAESCANALAKALTESESELASVSATNKSLKKKQQKLLRKNNQLESENEELLLLLDAIDDKLKKSHDVIDKLHKELDKHRSRQNDCEKLRSKWEEAKKVYQSKISELKHQLTHAEQMVPASKYHEAVESAQILMDTVKDKENEIEVLTRKVKELELQIEKSSKQFNTSDAANPCINKEHNHTCSSSPVVSPILNSGDVMTEKPWQDVFSPVSTSKSSLSKLKHRSESNKKSKKKTKKRLALTPVQGNNLEAMKSPNQCLTGKENLNDLRIM